MDYDKIIEAVNLFISLDEEERNDFLANIMVEVDLDDIIEMAGTERMEDWLKEHASEWGYSYVGDEYDCWG